MFLGYARGKVGSVVFSRLKGQQIARAHNAHPANPKSRPQMEQRMKMATAVAFYKLAVGKFFKFAFEDKPTTSSDFNEFVKRNIDIVPYLDKNLGPYDFKPVAPLVLSSGSLGVADISLESLIYDSDDRAFYLKPNGFSFLYGSNDYDYGGILTASNFFAKILEYSHGALRNGDLITTVTFSGNAYNDEPNDYNFGYYQTRIDVTDTRRLSELGANRAVDHFSALEIPCFAFPMLGFLDLDMALGFAIIVTRNVGGKIFATNSRLFLTDVARLVYNNFRTPSALIAATDSYGVGFTAILNPEGK